MKKLLLFLLVAVMALSFGSALAAKGDANLGRTARDEFSDSFMSVSVVGDTIYAFGWRNVYSWHMGESELTPYPYQDPEMDEEGLTLQKERFFSDGERCYLLASVYRSGESIYTLERVELREVIFDGGIARFGEPMEIKRDELTASYGDENEYLIQINSICCSGDCAYISGYKDNGEFYLYELSITDGEGRFLDIEDAKLITPYEPGQLLIMSYSYDTNQVSFSIYDIESESMTPACEPIETINYFEGVAYSQESKRLFYVSKGYIMATTDFDFANAQKVAEMSMMVDSQSTPQLMAGDYYVCSSYEGITVRNTSPEVAPERSLVVGSAYVSGVEDAYYDFTARHDDVALILRRDYQQDEELITAMMNRDDEVDVYVLNVIRQAYDAIFNRGYMAEIENEELKARIQRMYPGLHTLTMKDGAVLGLPVEAYGWIQALNLKGFEALGYSREQIPTNWVDFLKFLPEVAEKLPEDGSVRLFEDWQLKRDLQYSLVRLVLKSYVSEATAQGVVPDYRSDELREALELILTLDYDALGVPEEQEDDEARMNFYMNVGEVTLLIESDVGFTPGNYYSIGKSEPWPLTLSRDAQPVLPLEVTVAFINPFTKNYELAQEFLLDLANNAGNPLAYTVSDEFNEPARDRYFESNLAQANEYLEDLRAQYEKAEPVDRPQLEEDIKNTEKNIDYMIEESWEITPDSIKWYRENAQYLITSPYNPLNNDPSGESYELTNRMLDGEMDAGAFLQAIGRKAEMMALEGN